MPPKNPHFNSIKVRLEPNCFKYISHCNLFQFHKGTIRTNHLAQGYQGLAAFQFHKGTIRTATTQVLDTVTAHFNSIKVRLELKIPLDNKDE